MLRLIRPRLVGQARHYSGRQANSTWPPALPVPLPRSSARTAFHTDLGRFVNNAAVYRAVSGSWLCGNSAAAAQTLRIFVSDSTARTLALAAVPLDPAPDGADPIEAYYGYIGHLAEARGLDEAAAWVKALYGPFLANTLHAKAVTKHTSVKPIAAGPPSEQIVEQIAVNKEPATEQREQHLQEKPLGPIDLSSSDGMNLFDPESWLTESPTAQRLWKESQA